MSGDRIDAVRLGAYLDGELPLGEHLAFEAGLADDADLRGRIAALQALRRVVQTEAEYHAPPPGLAARLGFESLASPAPNSRTPFEWRRWLAWRPLLPAVAAAVLVAALLPSWRSATGDDARLLQEAISSHVRSTIGERSVDVASSDRHTVKPWLSARLDYSPPVIDPTLPGFAFLGGRLDYLDARPVAALVYRQRQHLIDAYVWPSTARDAGLAALSRNGFNGVHWVHAGMRWWLVSDLNRDELMTFARALAEADAAR